ncbi:hypothetical protein LBMAG37_18610 [Anaerolineae bacterium]|nr:hypothetical protein EMGBD1_08990 [Anaerolineaceae bacterium]GDX68706.1 hypothetical protein LBMAG37_18610 [Anaerolineae bacterium]
MSNRPPLSADARRMLAQAGLCASCQHVQLVESARGSLFMLCGLAKADGRFEKYPRLPVLHCTGHAPSAADGA